MGIRQALKVSIDTIMAVLLLLLMLFMVTGQQVHEWLGVAMIVLFVVHHMLNPAWFKNLFKREYTLSRVFISGINILLLLDVIALAISGVMMSGFVFEFLPINSGAVFSRKLHMLASYWGLILMAAHLGQHWGQMMGTGRKLFHCTEKSMIRTWALRLITAGVSCYGIYAFLIQNIPSYLLLKQAFVFFNFEKSAALYLFEYISMIVLFAALSYYINKALQRKSGKQK